MDATVRRSGSGAVPATSDLNWRLAGRGDFNDDGKADLLWRHAVDGRNAIWFMDGVAPPLRERLAAASRWAKRSSLTPPPAMAATSASHHFERALAAALGAESGGQPRVDARHRTGTLGRVRHRRVLRRFLSDARRRRDATGPRRATEPGKRSRR